MRRLVPVFAEIPPSLRPLSYFWASFRRTWMANLSTTFFTPLLYLASLGAGLGALVGHGHALASLGGRDYLSFVAPALLATTAMQVALGQGTYEVWGARNYWSGAYRSMQASPITIAQIVTGHMVWVAARVLLASALYLGVSAAFGTVRSPAAAGVLLVGPLVGLSFATPLAAYSVTARHDQPFSLIFRLLMLPLFLFSGTFFPLSQLPAALRWVAYALPLWHGVALSRSLYSGQFDLLADLLHLAYLAGVALAGFLIARLSYERTLSR
jgi:lipooligosaccharide transport system permease protein